MPPAVETLTPTDPTATENGTPKPVVGIIYPPPEVRNIVDKTASFVARNGFEFEARIRKNEQNNPKFNFLNTGDPYHAYYQFKVHECKEGKPAEAPAAPPPPGKAPPPAPTAVPLATHQKQQEILKQLQVETPKIPKEPPPEFEFVVEPPSISAMELDIVKLTAQFVARNGRQFLTSLMNREARNYQFDFLRPQHSLFQYFTRLLEQYTKVLIPPKDLMTKLTVASTDATVVLREVKTRADWMRYQEAQRKREEEEAERERVSYAQIDWHDFVVVETVDYQPFEMGSFPPPTTPEEVGARVLLQQRFEEGQEVEMQLDSDADTSDDEDQQVAAAKAPPPPPSGERRSEDVAQPPPTAPSADNVIIKKDYNPKAAPKPQARPPAPDEYLISPITGERIPASKVAEHMRIGLLDPRWLEERNRQVQEKMAQETVYAPGSSIESSLKALAERRTDIFGVGDEETAIGKKIGEEEKRKRDELLAKAAIETPPPPPPVSTTGEVKDINKAKDDKSDHGVVAAAPPRPPQAPSMVPVMASAPMVAPAPPAPMAPPQPPVLMMQIPQLPIVPQAQYMTIPQPMLHHMGMSIDDEPPNKRLRNEDQLMSEEAFLVRYPGLLHFSVAAPVYSEKAEWRLQGQQMNFSMHPTESIANVKQKISELTGMPPAKQKLYWEGLYFKDNYSLAFYNVLPEAVVQLQVKERGGRKK